MKWTLALLIAGAALAADGRLIYTRSFPGSVPAFLQVIVNQDGATEYREAEDDDQPVKFQLSPADTQAVFDLASKLDYFKRPLESGLKVAFMGAKTLRYENGDQNSETKYNYSEDPQARELQDWFEKMAESAEHRIDLDRAAKYDKLGVVKALTLLGSALDRKRLVGLDQFLPTLDRIAKNETYMHTARVRASEIAEAIRNPKPQ